MYTYIAIRTGRMATAQVCVLLVSVKLQQDVREGLLRRGSGPFLEHSVVLLVAVVVIVVATFFNLHFVNCKATLTLAIKSLRNKRQYKPK